MVELTKAESRSDNWLIITCLVILAAVAAAGALVYTRAVMVPFVLAVFITVIVSPAVSFLEQRLRLPRALALLLVALGIGSLLGIIVLVIGANVRSMMDNLQLYRDRLTNLAEMMIAEIGRLGIDLRSYGVEDMRETLSSLPLFSMLRGAAGATMNFAGDFILVAIFVVFLLSGRKTRLAPDSAVATMQSQIRSYLFVKTIASTITGTLTGLILWMLNLEMAFTFGLLAFVLNFIPNIGSMIATLLPLPIALLQYESVMPVVAAIAGPGAVQFLVGNVLEPLFTGESLDLHPVTVMFALIFWGLIWGVSGMILAAPLTVVIRVALMSVPQLRGIADLMAGRWPASWAAVAGGHVSERTSL